MNYPTIDELLNRINNRFLLANVIAERAKAIADGSLPYIDNADFSQPILTAMQEIQKGKITYKILEGPPQKQEKSKEIEEFWTAKEKIGSLEKEEKKRAKKSKSSKKK